MLMGSIASGDDGGGAGDWKGITSLSLDNGDETAGSLPSRSIIQIWAVPFHTTFVRQCLFFYAQLPQIGPADALGCRRTAPHMDLRQGFSDPGGVGLSPRGRVAPTPVHHCQFSYG